MARPWLRLKPTILGGTVAQAIYWARQLGFKRDQIRVVADLRSFRGIGSETPVYFVGTWWQHDDLNDALDYLEAIGIHPILAEEMVPREKDLERLSAAPGS